MAHFFFAYAHDAVDILEHYRKRSIIGNAASHSVAEQGSYWSRDLVSRFKRERIRRSAIGDDSDDLRPQIQAIANRTARADTRSLPDGHVNDVEVGDCREKLKPVGGDSFDDVAMIRGHEVPAVFVRQFLRAFLRFLIVVAKLNEIGSLGAHSGILLRAVSLRDDDVRRHVESPRGERDGLAVIAASRSDQSLDAFRFAKQFSGINHGSARLECPGWSMVLMF